MGLKSSILDTLVLLLVLLCLAIGAIVVGKLARSSQRSSDPSCEESLLSSNCDKVAYCSSNPTDAQCVAYCSNVFSRPSDVPGEPEYDPACAAVVCEPGNKTRECVCGFTVHPDELSCQKIMCDGTYCLQEEVFYSIRNYSTNLFFVPQLLGQRPYSAYLDVNLSMAPLGIPLNFVDKNPELPIVAMSSNEAADAVFPNTDIDFFRQPLDMAVWRMTRESSSTYIISWAQWPTLVASGRMEVLTTYSIKDGKWEGSPPSFLLEVRGLENDVVVARIGTVLGDVTYYLTLYGRSTKWALRQENNAQLWRFSPSKEAVPFPVSVTMTKSTFSFPYNVGFALTIPGTGFHFRATYNNDSEMAFVMASGTPQKQFALLPTDDGLGSTKPRALWYGQYLVWETVIYTNAPGNKLNYMISSTNAAGYKGSTDWYNANNHLMYLFMSSPETFFIGRGVSDMFLCADSLQTANSPFIWKRNAASVVHFKIIF